MPTTLLREMQQLLGTSHMDESLLRELWIQRLPETAQAIISIARSLPLAEAAEIADQVVERFQPLLNQVSTPTQAPVSERNVPSYNEGSPSTSAPSVEALWAEVAALRRDFSRIPLGRPARRRPSRSPRRTTSQPDDGYCWYHQRFGTRATRCIKPCTYLATKQGNFHAGP